jgi:hypothetical protein
MPVNRGFRRWVRLPWRTTSRVSRDIGGPVGDRWRGGGAPRRGRGHSVDGEHALRGERVGSADVWARRFGARAVGGHRDLLSGAAGDQSGPSRDAQG